MMSSKSCFIVESNKEDLEKIISFIQQIPYLKISGTASSYTEAIEFLTNNSVDILYVDINLKESHLNGLDIVNHLLEPPVSIVMSDDSHYAVEAFNIGKVHDFLLKPYTFERFLAATLRGLKEKRVHTNITPVQNSLFFKMGRKFQKFELENINYMEAFGIYLKIHSNDNPYPQTINETISSILNHVDNNVFVRIHKSYIINITKVTSFDTNYLYINDLKIPIGISYKNKIENLFKMVSSQD